MSSKAGVSPSAGLAVHCGTKHLLEAVARTLRLELAGTGVTVTTVRPGGVNTPGIKQYPNLFIVITFYMKPIHQTRY